MGKGSRRRPTPNYGTNFKRIKPEADWDYRNWIKEQPCLIGNDCMWGVDPHHVRSRGAGGRDHKNIVPLCRKHHTELHTIGKVTFEDKYKLGELILLAGRIYEDYESTK